MILSNMIDAQTAALIIAALMSPLVGLVTKWNAPSWLKSALNIGLTTLGAVLSTITFAPHATWQACVVLVAQSWAVSIGAHYGIYKPMSSSGHGVFQTPHSTAGKVGVTAPVLPHQRKHHRVQHKTAA